MSLLTVLAVLALALLAAGLTLLGWAVLRAVLEATGRELGGPDGCYLLIGGLLLLTWAGLALAVYALALASALTR